MAIALQQPNVQAPFQQPNRPGTNTAAYCLGTPDVRRTSTAVYDGDRVGTHATRARSRVSRCGQPPSHAAKQFRRGSLSCLASGMTRLATCRWPQRDCTRTTPWTSIIPCRHNCRSPRSHIWHFMGLRPHLQAMSHMGQVPRLRDIWQ